MKNVYEKSLELMDVHFESISNEDFMRDYLSVEKHQGPLVNEFLSDSNFFSNETLGIAKTITFAKTLSIFTLESFVSEKVENNNSILEQTILVERKDVSSLTFDSKYVANDECHCELGLVA